MSMKKRCIMAIPYLVVFYGANKLFWLFRNIYVKSLVKHTLLWIQNLQIAFRNPLPSMDIRDIIAGFIAALLLYLLISYRKKNAKKFRQGIEYGSAKWGNSSDIKPFMDPSFKNNILLTKTERITLNSKPKNPKYARNVLVIGGSGSGKTRYYVKTNLMQMHSSYVVTDPKGTVVLECAKMLKNHGYNIKILNTINFNKSMHYNPFNYIHSEKDILKLVNTLIANTKGEGEKANEDFWVKAERLYYTALIAYIYYEVPKSEQNFSSLLDLIDASETREDDDEFKNAVDLLFEDLEKKKPNSFALRQYKKYKLAAGKTARSILISCGARLAPFDIAELREIMSYDELELDTLGDKKSALFIVTSDTDSTFDFITALCISQMMNVLCTKADDYYGGSLPIHVRCLFDEFANIKIPDMQRLIAVIRSRNISASIILQSKSQLKANYNKHAETIEGNCDSLLFLGGKERETLKDLAELLGKETIDLYNTSDTRGNTRSFGTNFTKTGKDLMSRDEIAVMDGDKCILQLRGVRPFLSEKYDITKHPNYKELSDYDNKNTFDVKKYLATELKMKDKDEFDIFYV